MAVVLTSCATDIDESKRIMTELKSGDKHYFNQLFLSGEYDKLLDKIEHGDVTLIRSSYLFLPWIDASTSLSLKYSLSRALIQKPEVVMGLVPEYFSTIDICTIPYIEESLKVELTHVEKSIIALKQISKSSVTDSVIECISIYEKFKKGLP